MTEAETAFHAGRARLILWNLKARFDEPDAAQMTAIEETARLAEQIEYFSDRIRAEGADELLAKQHISATETLIRGLYILGPRAEGTLASRICDEGALIGAMLQICATPAGNA